MPGKGLLASITDKAQAAIAASPLAGKIPTGSSQAATGDASDANTTASTTQQQQPGYAPPAQEQSGTLGGRHYGIEAIQHQLRTLQVQYSSGVSQENRQLQLLITSSKGVALDFDTLSRDSKSQSKELYLWGQTQDADIKDVTDRLAYLNFVHGALSYTLATDIDKSRTVWKNVRDAEAALAPRRAARTNLTTQMSKVKNDSSGGTRIAELEAQLKKAEADDAPLEHELELLKRTAIKEGETIKWKALQEYAHKLLLLSGASEQLLRVLPSSRPDNYTGHQQTAAVRAALQNALDSGYVPKAEHLPLNVGQHVGETRSFGETHASELNTITTVTDNGHDNQSQHTVTQNTATHDAAPINPATLNNAPAPIPHTTSAGSGTGGTSAHPHYNAPTIPPVATHYAPPSTNPPSSAHAPATGHPSGYAPPTASPPVSTSSLPKAPTVAETGVPLSAGATGPGPASGNLNTGTGHPTVGYGVGTDEQAPPYGGAAAIAAAHESAEDEKRRLAAMEQAQNAVPIGGGGGLGAHQGGLHASTSTRRPPAHESAEDEKKRLEREERERVLHAGNPGTPSREPTQDDGTGGAAPPAYQD